MIKMININRQNKRMQAKVHDSSLYRSLSVIYLVAVVIAIAVMLTAPRTAAGAQVISYLYNLSNFNGPVLSHWANIYVDKDRKDVYIIDPRERDIRIFDENGMQVYLFGDDGRFGTISDLTVDGEGNIIILSRQRSGSVINIANYRGEPVSQIELKGFPAG